MFVRCAAGGDGSVAWGGDREGVRIVAILKPGPVALQTTEAILVEQLLPFDQVVAAHLVEDDQHDEFRLIAGCLRGGCDEGLQCKKAGEKE